MNYKSFYESHLPSFLKSHEEKTVNIFAKKHPGKYGFLYYHHICFFCKAGHLHEKDCRSV